jgi:superfamily II DNA/RNA helicase
MSDNSEKIQEPSKENDIDNCHKGDNLVSEVKKWDDIPLNNDILRGIYSHGFEFPSPIQSKGIIPMIDGKDMIAQSQSGTGKTATFVIGALSRIKYQDDTTQVLILTPTRELSYQIQEVIVSIGSSIEKLKSQVLVGGTSVEYTMRELKTNVPHIVVGCIGRVCDMIKRRALLIRNIQLLVIDEADEMLSYGFRDNVYYILDRLPKKRQVVVFSATMSYDMVQQLEEITSDPVHIMVKKEALTLDGISQYYVALETDEHKYMTLKDLYSSIAVSQCIIYCNNVSTVQYLTETMKLDGFPVSCIHSDMNKQSREEAISSFRRGNTRVLISSDITARGIDVQQVGIVINFDISNSVHTYLHRIGRSGRWGRKGVGINLITRRDVNKLRKIEQYYSTQIEELPMTFMDNVG